MKMVSALRQRMNHKNELKPQVKVRTKYRGTVYGGFDLAEQFLKRAGVIYSFGIGEDLSFSNAVMKHNAEIEIYAFDPTPKAIAYIKRHELYANKKFHFQEIGISYKNGNEQFFLPQNPDYVSGSVYKHKGVEKENVINVSMKCLKSIMEELGHNYIDVLKLDIEGAEYEVIPNILRDELQIGQICVEIHDFVQDKNRDMLIEELNRKNFWLAKNTREVYCFINKNLL